MGKSSEDTNIAVLALSVALYALIISLGQLRGQYFATAEGYRKCQPSVMGPWARRTRLRWRWSQFRFETLLTTPRIILTPFHVDSKQQRISKSSTDDPMEHISGSPDSRNRTMSVPSDGGERSSELACWLPFLESLHRNQWDSQIQGCFQHQSRFSKGNEQHQLVGPAVRFREMSWDFMPPDVVRPFAVTTVSDIAVMARRLGMLWKVFNPEDGNMRAEGNGHGISSTMVRSLGLVLQYIHIKGGEPSPQDRFVSDEKRSAKAEILIPTCEADMMGFGILPGFDRLQIPILKMGTIDEVCATMEILDKTRKISRKLRDMRNFQVGLNWENTCTFGFSDIIALAAPMMCGRHSTVVSVPRPAQYCSSLLCQKEGFIVFHIRLQEYLSSQAEPNIFQQATWVLQQYEGLRGRYSEWENEAFDRINDYNMGFLEDVHDCWDMTTDYFVHLQGSHQLSYCDLMTSHVLQALKYWGDAWNNVKAGKARDKLGMRAVEVEGMHLYFDYLPLLVADMRTKGFKGSEKIVHEAWFTLLFRALCWWRCHSLRPGDEQTWKGSIIPSKYWDSKLPVYIG